MDPITVIAFASFAVLVVAWVVAPMRAEGPVMDELPLEERAA
ncbi:MAG TPA: hypothetical protein VMJ92_01695 [Candidatus Limnocylindrales bacterium]|nr:hypothetical protein [Candidatus Limnocylindrales bacterium]